MESLPTLNKLVAVTTGGELCVLHPFFIPQAGEVLDKLETTLIAFSENKGPDGYVLEFSEGLRPFGPGILKLVEVVGEL